MPAPVRLGVRGDVRAPPSSLQGSGGGEQEASQRALRASEDGCQVRADRPPHGEAAGVAARLGDRPPRRELRSGGDGEAGNRVRRVRVGQPFPPLRLHARISRRRRGAPSRVRVRPPRLRGCVPGHGPQPEAAGGGGQLHPPPPRQRVRIGARALRHPRRPPLRPTPFPPGGAPPLGPVGDHGAQLHPDAGGLLLLEPQDRPHPRRPLPHLQVAAARCDVPLLLPVRVQRRPVSVPRVPRPRKAPDPNPASARGGGPGHEPPRSGQAVRRTSSRFGDGIPQPGAGRSHPTHPRIRFSNQDRLGVGGGARQTPRPGLRHTKH